MSACNCGGVISHAPDCPTTTTRVAEPDTAEQKLAKIRQVLRDPDLYDSYNSAPMRVLLRDIKEAMGLPLTGTDVPEPKPLARSSTYEKYEVFVDSGEADERFKAFLTSLGGQWTRIGETRSDY